MSTRSHREKGNAQNTNQVILSNLLKEECNKYCSDCGAKGPRWASWNLGVFLCIRCAGIHRNLGVHISKVKSVNLDSWTQEQMTSIQEWGNRRAGLYWECFLPKDFLRPQTNSAVETFIRNKYEHKKYAKKDGLPPKTVVQETTSTSTKSNKQDKVAAPMKTTAPVSRPKPQVQSPHPAAIPATSATVKSNPPSMDLLSLDTPAPAVYHIQNPVSQQSNSSPSAELIDFGSFQGAPQILSPSPPSQPQQLANMSQSAPPTDNEESLLKDDSSTNKSTKDSIMALYTGSGSSAAQQPQMYGIPGGMYIQPQPQIQKNPHNMYNRPVQTPYQPQPHVMPMHMQQNLMQHPTPQQQQEQLSQIQHQMQQLKLQKNQQTPFQQQQHQQQPYQQPPNMYSNNMFAPQQAMNTLMTHQHAIHYQQQQQPQFISTGPSSNMFPMNGMPSSGHTFNNQLWK